MNQESFQRFVGEYKGILNRTQEILEFIREKQRIRWGYDIDGLDFDLGKDSCLDEDSVCVHYTECVLGNSSCDFELFPARLLYEDNWKELCSQYLLERREKDEQELLQRQENAKRENQERLKKEF